MVTFLYATYLALCLMHRVNQGKNGFKEMLHYSLKIFLKNSVLEMIAKQID